MAAWEARPTVDRRQRLLLPGQPGHDSEVVAGDSVAVGTPAVPPVQRNQHRPGRLRWITGRRSEQQNWDAYEAPSGMPLGTVANGSQSWDALRFWLLDLAEELTQSEAEGTTPATLAEDRVWITADGHAKLLDFPAPGVAPSVTTYDSPVAFLHGLAATTLDGCMPPAPQHARVLMDPARPSALDSLLGTLQLAVRRPARISRLRRLLITVCVSAFPATGVLATAIVLLLTQSVRENNPDLIALSSVTMAIQYSRDDVDREQLRRYVAHRFRDLVEGPATWNGLTPNLIVDINRQRLAKRAVADYPSLTAEQIAAAENAAKPVLKSGPGDLTNIPDFGPLVFFFVSWITYAAIPALMTALIIRRGLILTIFGAVVVKADGRRASRLRALWRCLIAWSPFLLGALLAAALFPLLGAIATTIILPCTILVLAILAHIPRDRSLQDRLAGTWLVPK